MEDLPKEAEAALNLLFVMLPSYSRGKKVEEYEHMPWPMRTLPIGHLLQQKISTESRPEKDAAAESNRKGGSWNRDRID